MADADAPGGGRDRKLAHTVEHAYEQSQFYRSAMADAGLAPADVTAVEDLSQLPVVDGDDVLANQPPATETFRFRNDDADVRRQFHTSGTTGDPKVVFRSYDEVDAMFDDVARGHAHLGVSPGDLVVDYLPFVGLNVSCFGTEGGLAELGAETLPISNTPYPPETEADILRRRSPDVVEGLASHVDAKARALSDAGFDPARLGVDLVVVVGEPVSDARKHRIAAAYDAEVREYYGCTEAGAFAWECHEQEGLHVLEESVVVEVVDPETGEQLPPGEEGSLVVTPLLDPGDESAMPLLRYVLGDRVALAAGGDCDCALSGPRLLPGHREHQQFVVGAVNLSTQFVEEQLYGHPDVGAAVEEYRVRVGYEPSTGRDHLEVIAVADGVSPHRADDFTRSSSDDRPAAAVARRLLAANSHLSDTVETVDAVRLDVAFVEELDLGDGKPERLVDRRERRAE